jgi:hypothetical protein
VDYDTLMLRGIPARLKGKIARRVETDESNMNDVLVGILAAEYGVPFEPSGVKRSAIRKTKPSSQALLTMPAELKRLISVEAATNRDTVRNVAMRIIAEEFGETFKATGRWEKRSAAPA